jgi:hypothetical protein
MLATGNVDLPPGFDRKDHETPRIDRLALAGLCKAIEAKEVVEIGSWTGMSTLALAQPGVTVHCIDHWKGNPNDRLGSLPHTPKDVFSAFCKNIGDKLFRQVYPHVGTSEFYFDIWPRPVDLVFIDADHTYEEVRKDLRWARHVRPGGILCGHDYGVFPGVNRAVDESFDVDVIGNVWWTQVN